MAEYLAGSAIGAGTGGRLRRHGARLRAARRALPQQPSRPFRVRQTGGEKFVTGELIRRTTFTATEQELKQRVEALRSAGWSQLVIPITPGEERAIDDWARIKRAFD